MSSCRAYWATLVAPRSQNRSNTVRHRSSKQASQQTLTRLSLKPGPGLDRTGDSGYVAQEVCSTSQHSFAGHHLRSALQEAGLKIGVSALELGCSPFGLSNRGFSVGGLGTHLLAFYMDRIGKTSTGTDPLQPYMHMYIHM